MIDQEKLSRCRSILVDAVTKKSRVTYGEIANLIGTANQGLGLYLNAIYEEEIAKSHPDLTLVAVYSGTEYGRFRSSGAPAQSHIFDPNNPDDVKAYEAELLRVYEHKWL